MAVLISPPAAAAVAAARLLTNACRDAELTGTLDAALPPEPALDSMLLWRTISDAAYKQQQQPRRRPCATAAANAACSWQHTQLNAKIAHAACVQAGATPLNKAAMSVPPRTSASG